MEPLVSVVSTLYNYRDYVVDMIRSVQVQTHQNWELIIVDDASTDNPLEVLDSLLDDPRIQYIRIFENRGYSHAKNVGIQASKGEYIVMLDADDLLANMWSISKRLDALMKDPEALWIHGDAINLEPSGSINKMPNCRIKRRERRKQMTVDGTILTEYSHRLIHSQTIMVRKDFHRKLGLYDATLRYSSDNEMFRRAIRFGVIPIYIPVEVAIYRIHPNQMHRSDEKRKVLKDLKIRIIEGVEQRFKEGITEKNTPLLKE
jgi:glycosyltransferase involved in cell wall biosynthesis